jgi:protein-tyrosine phosphatase
LVSVLFVCTGNICRSPTAEGVLRALVEARGLADAVRVDSAGTHGYHVGEPPDPRAIAAARRRGIDLSELRARRVSRKDFERFDLIVAMDRGHHGLLLGLCPDGQADKLRLFMEYVPEHGLADVPDPYYGDAADFERVLDIVGPGAAAILEELDRRLRSVASSDASGAASRSP